MTSLSRRSRAAAVIGATLAITLLLAACGSNDDSTTGAGKGNRRSESPTSSGTAIAKPAAGPHNDTDTMWTSQMVPHHAQAVEMSELLLAKDGIDPAVSELAEQIKAAQAPEIEQMRGWLAGWGEPVPAADGSMAGMDHDAGSMGPGMMSDADMTELEDASGMAAQRLYLTQMVAHHQGAIEMSKLELRAGENAEATSLASRIITTQRSEITTMTELLAG